MSLYTDAFERERTLRDLISLAAYRAEKERMNLEYLCLGCLSEEELTFMELKKMWDVTAVGYERMETWVCPVCEWEEEVKVY